MRFEKRAVFESLELVLNSIRIEPQDNRKGYWSRLTTPPRPSATPPPAEEGTRVRVLPLTVRMVPLSGDR
jgi:hypothetical protein